jgi:hypothetical protein
MKKLGEHEAQQETQSNEALQVEEQNAPENVQDLQTEVETEVDAEQKTEPEPETKTDENPELNEFLNDTASSKKEQAENESEQAKAQHISANMDKDEAAQWAVTGIVQTVDFARKKTGHNLTISKTQLGLFSTLFVPVIMKHGNSVKRYLENMTEGIDEHSNMPEYVAMGGLGALGGSLYWEYRKAEKEAAREAEFQETMKKYNAGQKAEQTEETEETEEKTGELESVD